MKDEITTIDDLATLITRTMASKEDIQEVRAEMTGLRTEMDLREGSCDMTY
jgi:hypothetical protein